METPTEIIQERDALRTPGIRGNKQEFVMPLPEGHMGAGQNQRLVTRPGSTHATYPVTRGM